MDARRGLGAILRDAVLRTARQDEVANVSLALRAGPAQRAKQPLTVRRKADAFPS